MAVSVWRTQSNRIRVALLFLDRAGPSRRHPYPGQKFRHGWIPVAGGLLDPRRVDVEKHVARWHDDPEDVTNLVGSVTSGLHTVGPLAYGSRGRTKAELVDFDDGSEGVVTTHLGGDAARDADADQLSSTLARSIGIPAPRVMRVRDDATVAELAPGSTWAEREEQILADIRAYELERESPGYHVPFVSGNQNIFENHEPTAAAKKAQQEDLERQRATMLSSDSALRLGVFDLLAGIDERESGTIVVITGDGVVPVQSEFGWVYADGRKRAGELAAGRLSKADGKVAPVERRVYPPDLVTWSAFSNLRSWRDNPLTAADVAFLRARLDEAQPQFAKLGRLRWWQFASDRLDALAAHATGSHNLFAP